MAIATLTFTRTDTASYSGQGAAAAAALGSTSNSSAVAMKNSLGTAAANAAVGGADECAAFVTSVTASGSAVISLQSLTDILGATSVSLARVKDISFNLLSATQDTTIGTNCSSITIGNNGTNDWISQSHGGWFGGATATFDLPNGGKLSASFPTAGGNVVDGTHLNVKIANNDGSLTAKVLAVICGGTT